MWKVMPLKVSINKVLLVILLVTPFLITPGLDRFYFIKAVFILFATLLMMIKWILYEKSKKEKLKDALIHFKFGFAYLGLIVISVFFSVNPRNSIIGFTNRWEGLIILICYFLLMLFSFWYFEFNEAVLKLLLIAGVLLAIWGLLDFFVIIKDDFYTFPINHYYGRAFASLGNPNYLGNYLTIAFAVSTYFYFSKSSLLYLISTGLIYSTLLATVTRGSWVGSFIAFICLASYSLRRNRAFKKLGILVITLISITIMLDYLVNGVLVFRLLSIFFEFGNLMGPEPQILTAGSYRILIWTTVLSAIPQKPFFGVGISNLETILINAVNYTEEIYPRAHNEFIHIAATTGVPSLIMYTLMIGRQIQHTYSSIVKEETSILLFSILLGYCVQSFFSSSLVCYSFIFWILLGRAGKHFIETTP